MGQFQKISVPLFSFAWVQNEKQAEIGMSVYSVKRPVSAIMRQESERKSQKRFSTGDPDFEISTWVQALFSSVSKESQQHFLSPVLGPAFFSHSVLGTFLPPTVFPLTESTANPLRQRPTQKLTRLGHYSFLHSSLSALCCFSFITGSYCLCMWVTVH